MVRTFVAIVVMVAAVVGVLLALAARSRDNDDAGRYACEVAVGQDCVKVGGRWVPA